MTDPNYSGEAQLLSWSTSPAGRKITLLLPEDTPDHPFKGYKTGPKYGQCFAIMTQPIDYDNPESDAEPQAGEPVKSVAGYAKTMTESQICGMLCADPGFQEWLALHPSWQTFELCDPYEDPTDGAAAFVRWRCGMDSRSALDSDPEGEHTRIWQRLRSQYETDTGRVAERRR